MPLLPNIIDTMGPSPATASHWGVSDGKTSGSVAWPLSAGPWHVRSMTKPPSRCCASAPMEPLTPVVCSTEPVCGPPAPWAISGSSLIRWTMNSAPVCVLRAGRSATVQQAEHGPGMGVREKRRSMRGQNRCITVTLRKRNRRK